MKNDFLSSGLAILANLAKATLNEARKEKTANSSQLQKKSVGT